MNGTRPITGIKFNLSFSLNAKELECPYMPGEIPAIICTLKSTRGINGGKVNSGKLAIKIRGQGSSSNLGSRFKLALSQWRNTDPELPAAQYRITNPQHAFSFILFIPSNLRTGKVLFPWFIILWSLKKNHILELPNGFHGEKLSSSFKIFKSLISSA